MEESTTFGDDSDKENPFNLCGDLSDDTIDTTEMEIFDATQSSKSMNSPSALDVSHTISKSC